MGGQEFSQGTTYATDTDTAYKCDNKAWALQSDPNQSKYAFCVHKNELYQVGSIIPLNNFVGIRCDET